MRALNASDMETGAADDSARLHFLHIPDDGILSGDVLFNVTFADDSFWGEELTLYFDGEVYTYTRAFPEASADQQTLGKEIGTFGIMTYRHINAPHQLEVRDNFGNSSTRSVVFRNVISEVDLRSSLGLNPPGPSVFPYYITAVLSPPQSWRVEIEGVDDSPIQSFEGRGDKIEAQWDGLDAEGNIADCFPYRVTMIALKSGVTFVVGCINKLS